MRVVYVGHIMLGDTSATGYTLAHIFDACKNVTLAQYALDYDPRYHNPDRPITYISKVRSRLFCCLKQLYRRKQERGGPHAATTGVTTHKGSLLVDVAKGLLDLLPKRWSKADLHALDESSPEIIYTLAENISTLRAALYLSKRYDAPIIIHVMDDIESTIYQSYPLTKWLRYKYLKLLHQAYQRSKINLAIGEKMATEFAARHKTPFEVAMNCLDTLHAQPQPNNTPMRLVFSGGLHGGRAQSLALMADIIARSPKLSGSAKLIVYTSPQNRVTYQSMLLDRGVEVYDYVPKSEMFANLGKADVLIHVESFMPEEIEYFKYSMSTKIPEYMSVGRPIVCFGPREICTVDYIERKGVGLVASNENELIDVLTRVIVDAKLRQDLSNQALGVAEKEHLASAVAERVERVFATAIKSRNIAKQ